MNYSLETPILSIEVTKSGIELCSVKSKVTGNEYMWQANPEIWGSHAPVLFPIIGALKEGEFIYKGANYPLPKHGFIRYSDKPRLVEQTEHSLTFRMNWNKDTYKIYPFEFEFQVTYKVHGNTIEVIHSVSNTDDKTLFYSVGGHPAFNCPLNADEEYEDYYLEFEKKETDQIWLLDENGLLSGETKPFLTDTKILPLHKNLFDNDALIFKNLESRTVHLVSKKSGRVLSVSFADFEYLGIWAKPGAPFICIEPWLGVADDSDSDQILRTKEGIRELEPGKNEINTYSITIA